ncbi:MAG: M1 family metallopeptidase [Acidobacteria bacterium]|nr:M1 family metallopeptidase [Acidobacteriota bacterium]
MHDATAATGEALYRLPRTVLPRRYDLRIEPDLATARFTGTEDVAVEVVADTSEVVLNAKDLEIGDAWLLSPAGEQVGATTSYDEATERLTLSAARALTPGNWTVHVAFAGEINDKLKGFYRSVFTDGDGVERVIGTTQMEPTDARLAFPCWDEPDLKATFAITLVVADGLLTVSNAAESARTTLPDGRVEVRFADTIPMSTYLVAWVIGPLVATDAVDVDGVPLRVVHVPGKESLAPFALDVGAFALRLFTGYYGIPYPGDKCDLIALPDFAAGAMENLGAITFREAVLLVDPAEATRSELQRVADVISHELAHMWFGDLVTMKWWNGLWLNEAFATFMELAAVDAFRPEWQRWVSFTNERAGAFAIDGLASTRPIEYPVHSPEEAEGMFDLLTYEKGASVLRMLEQYLGEDGFRAGIRRYLHGHEYGNAETTDLWDAIEEATDEPVRRIMDTWIFQGGHPLIGVDVDGERVTLTQRRFRFLPDDGEATWAVPLLVSVDGGEPEKLLLDSPSMTVELPGASKGIVVNAGGHGFYRVRYSSALLGQLRSRVFDLEPVERALLVDDAWASVLAAQAEAPAFLELAGAFGEERDPAVWTTLTAALGAIDRILDGDGRAKFQGYVRRLVGPALEQLGWEPQPGEDDLTGETRKLVITALGTIGRDQATIDAARELLDRELAGAGTAGPDVAAAAVTVVAANGTTADWERYLDRYRTATNPQEQLRYQYGLGQFAQPELASRTLELCMTEFRTQNAPFVLLMLLTNRDVNATAWEFVKREWDRINERFPDNAIPRLLGGITALSTPELAADVEAFVAAHPVPQAAKTVEQHLERLRVNVALRQREAARITAALA